MNDSMTLINNLLVSLLDFQCFWTNIFKTSRQATFERWFSLFWSLLYTELISEQNI